VKWAISRYAARCLSPHRAQARIKEAIGEAVRRCDALRPYVVNPPVTARVQWKDTGSAQRAARVPGVRVVTDDTVEFTGDTMGAVFEAYQTMVGLYTPAWGSWIKGGH
jgi:D-amino peptidase